MQSNQGSQWVSRAPEPTSQRIASLIQRIDDGDIKLPTFQRPQVWNVDQVIDLLDSVNRGYPVGSLLFWETSTKLRYERNIGGFELPDTRERHPRNYVLDGQQRLTTLYAVLKRSPEQLAQRLRVVYDLTRKEFVPAAESVGSQQVPLNLLYDTNGFMNFRDHLRAQENGDKLVVETQLPWETFQNYVVPVVTVPEAPIDKVGVIFERINSRGTRLTVFDLMVAATWAVEGTEEFNLKDSVDNIVGQLDEKDYGGVDAVSILRSLSVVDTGSARRESILALRDHARGELELLLEKTRVALTRAVDFLISETSVISSDFLPYERQLILLTYVMDRNSTLTAADYTVLRQWFWRTSFSERYRAGGEAFYDEDLQRAVVALKTSKGLDRFGTAPSKSFFVESQFRKGAAASQAFAALLGTHNPRNITNEAVIDVGTALSTYNRKEFHHLFPQKVLKDRGVGKELINSLANICMLASSENKIISDRLPSEYIRDYQTKLGSQFQAVMDS
ncbi:MAG: DUF262 domain-containing protein, partial [Rubrobacter sp.]